MYPQYEEICFFLKSVMEHQKGVADNHQSLGKVLIGPWTLITNVLTLI